MWALDPRDVNNLSDLGASTLAFLRRYEAAIELRDRALDLAPNVLGPAIGRAEVWVVWHGRLDSLAAALDRLPPGVDRESGPIMTRQAGRLHWARQPDSLLGLLRRIPRPVIVQRGWYTPKALWAAWAHQLRGDSLAASLAFDSAGALLDSLIHELPNDYGAHSARGLALAGRGRRTDALGEARWLQQSVWYRTDRYSRPVFMEQRAMLT